MMIRTLTAVVLALSTVSSAQTQDPTMTRAERAELIDLLNKSRGEFLEAVEGLSDRQWSFKAGPDRWSIAEVAEHMVLGEAQLFATATRSLAAPADEKWSATVGKTAMLRRALPDRSTKVVAPQEIAPKGGMTRDQVMARFQEQRARTLAYAEQTEAPLKAHTSANPFFGALNAHQWLLYIPLHQTRHNLQIAEVKTSPDYPR